MKKTIVVVAILAMVLITMMGSVNAASVTANKEVEKGKTVTVTVNMEATSAVQFDMSYDNTKFEFVGASAGALGSDVGVANGGVVKVAAFALDGKSTTKSVTVTFKTLATTEGEKFTVDGLVTENGEAIANPAVTVKVTAPVEVKPGTDDNKKPATDDNNKPSTDDNKKPATDDKQQGTTATPVTDDKKQETTTKSQNADQKIGTNGKVITKLPQTGTPVFIGVATIIAIAGVALVVRKAK